MEIRGTGVACGRKWARDVFTLWRKSVITVPAHRGTAMPRSIESCIVGVNECGNSPSRFVDLINEWY